MTSVLTTHRAATSYRAFGRKTVAARTAGLVLLFVSIMAAACPAPHAEASFEPFAPGSPFRTTIPDGAAIDPNSDAMVARIARDNGLYSNLVEFGIPIYHADPQTHRYSVRCTTDWGRCPFSGYEVPMPAGARPSPGLDGAMVVIDASTRRSFEFWRAREAGNQWTASWGAVNNLDGSGWGGSSTGSGASRLAGVIHVAEIRQGEIPHALALQADNVCANVFRPPALKTDGHSSRSDCIPEGARVRLDPEVDLASLELAPAVRMVARAMQVYGGYIVDNGGAPLSVSFELDTNASKDSIGSVYLLAGLNMDYDPLRGVPWNRLQVLA